MMSQRTVKLGDRGIKTLSMSDGLLRLMKGLMVYYSFVVTRKH
jgi:hypothetical protein